MDIATEVQQGGAFSYSRTSSSAPSVSLGGNAQGVKWLFNASASNTIYTSSDKVTTEALHIRNRVTIFH